MDKSLFEYNGTTIPSWACAMWNLPEFFSSVSSRNDSNSEVTVIFRKKSYKGWVTVARHKRISPAFRLWFEEDLSIELKRAFPMSYMRSLEMYLEPDGAKDVERLIPFWEFLDIEFDQNSRTFRFVSYYCQEPSFPNLFSRLVGSPAVQKIDDEVLGKRKPRIFKQDWKPRGELEYEIGASNVIYMLVDTANCLFYIGEAKDLVKRLLQRYSVIPNWDFFRYDVLPEELAPFRVAIERMMIRDFATLMTNRKGIESLHVSNYTLVNERIDK